MQKIIDEILKRNNFVYPVFGFNNSGKTKLLFNIYHDLKEKSNINCISFDKDIEKEFDSEEFIKKINLKIESFLNRLFHENNLNKKARDEVHKVFLEKIVENIKLNNDEYFEKSIAEGIICDNTKNDDDCKYFNFSNNRWTKDLGNGSEVYTLLKFLLEIIKAFRCVADPKNEIKTILFINEPEIYCHPSLIKRIFRIFRKMADLNLNVIFSTHSPFSVFEFLKYSYSNRINSFMIQKNKRENINAPEINLIKINQMFFSEINMREIKLISEIIFSDNPILVEGLKDYQLFFEIIENNMNDTYYDIYDCGGKQTIKKIAKVIKEFFFINCFIAFDRDYKDYNKNYNLKIDSDNFLNDVINSGLYYYEFKDRLEEFLEGIDEKQHIKNDISHITFNKIKNLKGYENLVLVLKKYFVMNNNIIITK
ncbi:MAG: TOPRIM nucleotidyl transferase/hydrolase domain-containing protein [Mycoplasmoidaceae bacterium]